MLLVPKSERKDTSTRGKLCASSKAHPQGSLASYITDKMNGIKVMDKSKKKGDYYLDWDGKLIQGDPTEME